jgi:hypothetical protein
VPFAEDTFTVDATFNPGSRLDNLTQGHIGENTSWENVLEPAGVFLASGGRTFCATAPAAVYGFRRPAKTPDFDVKGTYYVFSSIGTAPRITGRQSITADTHYGVTYDASAGDWVLYKRIAGTDTALDTYMQPLDLFGSYVVKLQMRGDAIKVFIDGTERMSVTDSSITDELYFGIYATYAATAFTGIHLDALTATNEWEADAILADRFGPNETDGGDLTAHISDNEKAWAKHPGQSGTFLIYGGRGQNGSGIYPGGQIYCSSAPAFYVSDAAVEEELDVDAVFMQRGSSRSSIYLTLRTHATDDSAYLIGYNAASSRWEVFKRVAGVNTSLGHYDQALSDYERYVTTVELRGTTTTTLRVLVDGVERISVSDSSTPHTAGAIGAFASNVGGTTTKARIDQITATPPLTPPADEVFFDGEFDPTLSNYPAESSSGHRLYVQYFEDTGGLMTMGGVGGRRKSVEVVSDRRRVASGVAARLEVRGGDIAGSNVRERIMPRVDEAAINGYEEYEVFYGFSIYLPEQKFRTALAGSNSPVNTVFSFHNRALVPPVSDPAVENFSLMVNENYDPPTLGARFRGGWQDNPGNPYYQTFKEWAEAYEIEFDKWIDVVIYCLNSADPGVGRFSLWIAPEDEPWNSSHLRVANYPGATMHKARSNYGEWGYYRDNFNLPNLMWLDQVKNGTSFDAVDPKAP